MVIPRFIMQALKNEAITVYGDGTQTRSFTSVYDVVWALIKLSETKNSFGEIFNIGNNDPITIRELAELVIKLTNSKSKIQYIDYKDAFSSGFEDMKYRVPDISKIKNFIGYNPKIKIVELLNSVIEEKKTLIWGEVYDKLIKKNKK